MRPWITFRGNSRCGHRGTWNKAGLSDAVMEACSQAGGNKRRKHLYLLSTYDVPSTWQHPLAASQSFHIIVHLKNDNSPVTYSGKLRRLLVAGGHLPGLGPWEAVGSHISAPPNVFLGASQCWRARQECIQCITEASQLYKWGKYGCMYLRNLFKVSQLIRGEIEIQTWARLVSNSWEFPFGMTLPPAPPPRREILH